MADQSVKPLDESQTNKNEPVRCGGFTGTREITDTDKALFDKYRDIIEEKLQSQFGVPKDFKLEPSKVRTQVVAGVNYYFHVRLPNGKFAHVKIFEPLKGHPLENRERSTYVTVDESEKDS